MDSGLHGDPDSEQFRSTFISDAVTGISEASEYSWMAVLTVGCNGERIERVALKGRTVMTLYISTASELYMYKEIHLFLGRGAGAVGLVRICG